MSQASRLENVNNLMCVIIHTKEPLGAALIFTAASRCHVHASCPLAGTCPERAGGNGVKAKSDMIP